MKNKMLSGLLRFSAFLLCASALGYLCAPAKMLSVVGIVADARSAFLVRTLAAAFLSLGPVAYAAANGRNASLRKTVIIAVGAYFILGSLVDLHAFLLGIVGSAALPSVVVRVVMGIAIIALSGTRAQESQS